MAKKHWAVRDVPVYILSNDPLDSAEEPEEDPAAAAPEDSGEVEGGLIETWLTLELTPLLPRSPGSWVSPRRSCQRH